jgi:hypothetical protein
MALVAEALSLRFDLFGTLSLRFDPFGAMSFAVQFVWGIYAQQKVNHGRM